MVKCLPSSWWQKWQMLEKMAKSPQSNVVYLSCAVSNLAEKKPIGRQLEPGLSFCCRTAPKCVADASVASESSAVSLGKARHTDFKRAALMSLKATVITEDQVRIAVEGEKYLGGCWDETWVEVDSSEETLKLLDSTRLRELLDGSQLVQ